MVFSSRPNKSSSFSKRFIVNGENDTWLFLESQGKVLIFKGTSNFVKIVSNHFHKPTEDKTER
jgi:hypothetical protein